jgi:hypothetical protein
MPSQGIVAAEFDGNRQSARFHGTNKKLGSAALLFQTDRFWQNNISTNSRPATDPGTSMASTSLWKSSRPNNDFDSPARTEPTVAFYLLGNWPIRYLMKREHSIPGKRGETYIDIQLVVASVSPLSNDRELRE